MTPSSISRCNQAAALSGGKLGGARLSPKVLPKIILMNSDTKPACESVKNEKLIFLHWAFACGQIQISRVSERKVCIVIFHVLWFPRRPLSSLFLAQVMEGRFKVLRLRALKINSRGALCAMPAVIAPEDEILSQMSIRLNVIIVLAHMEQHHDSARQLHYSRAPDSPTHSTDFWVVISLWRWPADLRIWFRHLFLFCPSVYITVTRSLIVACEGSAKTRISTTLRNSKERNMWNFFEFTSRDNKIQLYLRAGNASHSNNFDESL